MWECRSWNASESDPLGSPLVPFPGYHVIGSDQTPHEEWTKTIEDYSGRQLTHWTDRLIALSGLASQTQMAVSGERYIAGLWRGDVIKDLLWYCQRWIELLWKCSEYLAPTWSWASVIGPVWMPVFKNYFGHDLVDEISSPSILATHVILTGTDPFGQVRKGCLCLSGCLRKAIAGEGDTEPVGAEFAFPLSEEGSTLVCGNFTPDCEAEPRREPVFLLRMLTTTWPDDEYGQFLVLGLLPTGRADDELERCEMGEIIDTHWFDGCEARTITIV